MSLTDFHPRPACLSRASGWSLSSTPEADLSCCLRIPLVACYRHYPGGTDGVRLLLTSPTLAFPFRAEGRLPRLAFSGPARRSLALWPADSLSCPRQPFDIEGFRPFVASRSAPTASWVTTSFQVWVSHPRELRDLSRRTPEAQVLMLRCVCASRKGPRPIDGGRIADWKVQIEKCKVQIEKCKLEIPKRNREAFQKPVRRALLDLAVTIDLPKMFMSWVHSSVSGTETEGGNSSHFAHKSSQTRDSRSSLSAMPSL